MGPDDGRGATPRAALHPRPTGDWTRLAVLAMSSRLRLRLRNARECPADVAGASCCSDGLGGTRTSGARAAAALAGPAWRALRPPSRDGGVRVDFFRGGDATTPATSGAGCGHRQNTHPFRSVSLIRRSDLFRAMRLPSADTRASTRANIRARLHRRYRRCPWRSRGRPRRGLGGPQVNHSAPLPRVRVGERTASARRALNAQGGPPPAGTHGRRRDGKGA